MNSEEIRLADHARMWHEENGRTMPEDETSEEFLTMYREWADWAFEDFA